MKANRAEIPMWGAADMDIDEEKIGLKGSPTQVRKIFTPSQRVQGVIINKDNARESVNELVQKLTEAKII